MFTVFLGVVLMPVLVMIGTIISYKPSNINENAEKSGFKSGRRTKWNFSL